jgi:hypothetical protein
LKETEKRKDREDVGVCVMLLTVCGEKRLRCERREVLLSIYGALSCLFLCMMPAKAARSPEAIAPLSACGVAAVKFHGPRPNESGDDVPVEAQRG